MCSFSLLLLFAEKIPRNTLSVSQLFTAFFVCLFVCLLLFPFFHIFDELFITSTCFFLFFPKLTAVFAFDAVIDHFIFIFFHFSFFFKLHMTRTQIRILSKLMDFVRYILFFFVLNVLSSPLPSSPLLSINRSLLSVVPCFATPSSPSRLLQQRAPSLQPLGNPEFLRHRYFLLLLLFVLWINREILVLVYAADYFLSSFIFCVFCFIEFTTVRICHSRI